MSVRDFFLTIFSSLIQLAIFIIAILILWNPFILKGVSSDVNPVIFLLIAVAIPAIVLTPSIYLGYTLQNHRIAATLLSIIPTIGLIVILFLKALVSFPDHSPVIISVTCLWILLFFTLSTLASMVGTNLSEKLNGQPPAAEKEQPAGEYKTRRPVPEGTPRPQKETR